MITRIMKALAFTAILCTLLFAPAHAQVLDSSRTPGIEVLTIHSKILDEKRSIRIRVPAGHDEFTAYPVLYVLDGEAQTNLAAAQVQYLSESYKIIPNLIVVGIDNTDRMRDLTPSHTDVGPDGKIDTSARAPFKTSGGGEKFLQFIKEELMPFVNGRYNTAPYSILYGHSLGALMAVYCLVNHPGYFNAYVAISPSFQWDDGNLLKQVAVTSFDKEKNRVLFFSDANEDAAFHQNQLIFDSLLRQKKTDLKVKRMFYPGESHISEPVKAFYDGIRFVYPDWHLPFNSSAFRKVLNSGVVKEQYAGLSKLYGYEVVPPHDEMLMIARFLRNDPARIKDAIDILTYASAYYMNSPALWETLGDTWVRMQKKTEAVQSYKNALGLRPNDGSLKQKIEQTQAL